MDIALETAAPAQRARDRLAWPVAVLAIGGLSTAVWGGLIALGSALL